MYNLIAYKPDSGDYDNGCYPSDLQLFQTEEKIKLINKFAQLKAEPLEYKEAVYEVAILKDNIVIYSEIATIKPDSSESDFSKELNEAAFPIIREMKTAYKEAQIKRDQERRAEQARQMEETQRRQYEELKKKFEYDP